ncbi:hypothetical protein [Alkalibaculum bacchi]|uniref:hypothetical protein n=1 Tax=Alkalibaculum bacchi TaxID=645887 RepID=UPI0026EF580D|nr:hypothetical protein [Alkalibaculum bacchi]
MHILIYTCTFESDIVPSMQELVVEVFTYRYSKKETTRRPDRKTACFMGSLGHVSKIHYLDITS